MRQVSTAFKRAVNGQETSEAFILLVTISHSAFTDDMRIASDPFELLPNAGVNGVISRGLEYIYLPFSINLPQQDDTGIARAQLQIDNVDRRIINAVRSANSPLSITLEVVLSSDVDTPEISIEDFRLERVEYDSLVVSGDISVEYFELEPFPAGRFTPSDFPGMF